MNPDQPEVTPSPELSFNKIVGDAIAAATKNTKKTTQQIQRRAIFPILQWLNSDLKASHYE